MKKFLLINFILISNSYASDAERFHSLFSFYSQISIILTTIKKDLKNNRRNSKDIEKAIQEKQNEAKKLKAENQNYLRTNQSRETKQKILHHCNRIVEISAILDICFNLQKNYLSQIQLLTKELADLSKTYTEDPLKKFLEPFLTKHRKYLSKQLGRKKRTILHLLCMPQYDTWRKKNNDFFENLIEQNPHLINIKDGYNVQLLDIAYAHNNETLCDYLKSKKGEHSSPINTLIYHYTLLKNAPPNMIYYIPEDIYPYLQKTKHLLLQEIINEPNNYLGLDRRFQTATETMLEKYTENNSLQAYMGQPFNEN